MFRFPLWLVLWGAVLPVISLLEGIVPLLLLRPAPIRASDWEQLWDFCMVSARYGVAVGVVLGLIAIGVCFLRRGRAGSSSAMRFELNLRWCLMLALLVIVLNDAAFLVVVKALGGASALISGPLRSVQLFPLALATILNLVGVLWAIARTISSNDVLTPRVLMEKVRRSAKLVG